MPLLASIAGPVSQKTVVPVSGGPAAYDAAVNSHASLLAYWLFDETSGTTAVDSAGSNDATYSGLPVQLLPGLLVVPGTTTCVALDGGNDHVQLPGIFDQEERTIEFWIRPTDAGDLFDRVMTNNSSYVNDCCIIWGDTNESNSLIFCQNDGTEVLGRSDPMVIGQAYHIMATYDSTNGWLIYQNGALVTTVVAIQAGWSFTAGTGWRVGSRSDGANRWQGEMDRLAFYTTALTAGDALTHWQAAGGT